MQALQKQQHLDMIFRAALERVDPLRMISDHVSLQGERLLVAFEGERHEIDLAPFERIVVLGTGKATAPMAKALEDILGQRISQGCIVVKYGHTTPLQRIETIEAGHPVPDESGVAGARRIRELAEQADEKTLVLTLVSGGGSALLPAPLHCSIRGQDFELSLEDKQLTTRALLRCGADITEINCIRKHLSDLKGGRLLQHIAPASCISFILSDVVGDDLSSIASGLTSSDPTTYADALGIVEKYGIAGEITEKVLDVLRAGEHGDVPETLKADSSEAQQVMNLLIGTNARAMAAAGEKARNLGYQLVSLTSRITGEAREVAKVLAAVAVDLSQNELLATKPACVISGGEPVVTLRGQGKGGRNQELALAYLAEMQKSPELFQEVAFLAASTDGNDGPTDAAGAYAWPELLKQADAAGVSLQQHLRENDAYHFYEAIDALCKTGPTNTNVCDLHIALVG